MLTNEQIRRWAGGASYQRGCEYFLQGNVKRLQQDTGGLFVAAVKGARLYRVELAFDAKGELSEEFCDCPAFDKGYGLCKHIVAVMKTLQRDWAVYFPAAASPLPMERPVPPREQKGLTEATRRMLSMFRATPPPCPVDSQPVRLEPVFHFVPDAYSRHGGECWLEFSIGVDRLYVLKDIPGFLQALESRTSVAFGKQFELKPGSAVFDEPSRKLIALMREVFDEERERARWSYYKVDSQTFAEGRRFRLTRLLLRIFFEFYAGRSVEVAIANLPPVLTPVVDGRPPVRFALEAVGEGLRLDCDLSDEVFYSLDADLGHVYHKATIYRVDDEFCSVAQPLLQCFLENRGREIFLPAPVVSEFASLVLPEIERLGLVDVADGVQSRLCREPLEKVVFLDRLGEGVCARVELRYGETVINPVLSLSAQTIGTDERCLVRDARAELQLQQWFRDNGFLADGELLVLTDEAATYDFLQQALPELNELAVVYYGDDFRSMRIHKTVRVKAGVRLNQGNDLLELTLDCEGMSPVELFELVTAYRLKKRYHRLGDGGYLSLDSPEFETAATLIEQLGLCGADMEKPVIELPKFRALYLDSLAKESGALYLERSSAFRQMIQDLREPQAADDALPEGIHGTLREYQKTGYRWLKSLARHGMGGILADDMGLGKTLQVLAFLLSERADGRPSLVVAPTSLVYNWQEEAAKFTPDLRVLVVSGQAGERQLMLAEASQADLVVTSYGMLKRDLPLYAELKLKYCFLDEAQNVKNPHTLNAKSVKRIQAGACFALTGTPIENSLTELWSVFDFIMPGYLRNHHAFVNRFESPIVKNADPVALRELGRHIRPFVMRRMKKAVLSELPDKIESKMSTSMTEEQAKLYAGWLLMARREFDREVESRGFDQSRIKILALLTRLRQICCHPSLFIEDYEGGSGKLEMLAELVREAVDGGHRALIFSQFTGMLELIKPVLAEAQVTYHYLDGSTPAQERLRLVNAFNGGDRDVFLISLKAGGTGLNLTGADMVIHCDPWWNPAVEDQATDRAYRIGQQNVVQVFKLVAKGTIEEKIHALQEKKRELIDALIQPGESFLSKMSEAEIRELFEGG